MINISLLKQMKTERSVKRSDVGTCARAPDAPIVRASAAQETRPFRAKTSAINAEKILRLIVDILSGYRAVIDIK